jgi:hypothetical protein
MKLALDKPAAKKRMRVATTLTGVTACAAAFAPVAAAQAATHAARPDAKLVTIPVAEPKAGTIPSYVKYQAVADAAAPDQPFSLGIWVKASVSRFRVCGWHPTNDWRCTGSYTQPYPFTAEFTSIGGNITSWDRGLTDVYWNGGAAGHRDTCNTNGDYNGYLLNSHYVILGFPSDPIGDGVPTC